MKVMLVNPASSLLTNSRRYSRFVSPLPPSGIAYIAAVLERDGFEVFIEDQVASRLDDSALLKRIGYLSPQVIGFSCLTSTMGNVKVLVEKIRQRHKGIKIVLGNIHPTLFTDSVIKEGLADIVVRGEGEYSMLEVVKSIRDNADLRPVEGISFRSNGTVMHNPDRQPIEELSQLPYPAWHLFNLRHYTNFPIIALYDETIFPIQSSRGCPYRCYFCSQDKIYSLPRYRQVRHIADEIETFNEKFNVRYFGFNDAFFPFSLNHGMDFCDEIIRRKLHKKIRWITETRVDKVSPELLRRMKEAGLRLIMYGFEVGNQVVLDGTNKKTTLKQARIAMQATKRAGIISVGLFMLGLPGETRQTCDDTIRFAKELDPDIAKFNVAVPFPGSKFFEDYRNAIGNNMASYEKFTSWYDYSSFRGSLIYTPDSLTSRELIDLQRKAMFEFYVRPVKIWMHLVKRLFPLKDLLYGFFVLFNRYLTFIFGWLRPKGPDVSS